MCNCDPVSECSPWGSGSDCCGDDNGYCGSEWVSTDASTWIDTCTALDFIRVYPGCGVEVATETGGGGGTFTYNSSVLVCGYECEPRPTPGCDRVRSLRLFPLAPPPPPPHPPSESACAAQDPHLHFAFGGSADFRGRHNVIYNFLSAPGIALNVKTEDSTFKLHGGKLVVEGSFMTEAHLTAVSLPKNKFANVSYWASELNEENTGMKVVNGTCGGHKFTFGRGGQKQCEEMAFSMSYSSATWTNRDWIIKVRGNHVHDRVTGPEHRLDISMSAKGGREAAAASLPHGLLGQSFAAVGLPRNGRKDVYPV